MAFVVVYDASVLYPSTLRDLMIRIAQSGLAQAKWTDHILDEMFGALRRQRPDLDNSRLDRTRELMGRAVRDWNFFRRIDEDDDEAGAPREVIRDWLSTTRPSANPPLGTPTSREALVARLSVA
jgi:hypothetical protein